jgi:hypothetical protein
MAAEFQERRRSPRITVKDRGQEFRLGRRVRVRVIDISASGALLAADEQLPLGAKGRVQMLLGGAQFEGQVEITRQHPGPADAGHLLGVTLVPTQPRHHEALEQFLRRAGT